MRTTATGDKKRSEKRHLRQCSGAFKHLYLRSYGRCGNTGIVAFGRVSGTLVELQDRKSTRLNSSHANISYAVFCLKKKKRRDGLILCVVCFFFNDTATTEIYTLSLHDALPI